jgi:hypothetical protein
MNELMQQQTLNPKPLLGSPLSATPQEPHSGFPPLTIAGLHMLRLLLIKCVR